MAHYELNLRDYWRIIKKKRVIVIVTLIMLSLFSLIFAIMNRPEPLYRAQASLKIEKRTDLTGLYLYSWGSGDDLATRAEEIKSYPMLEKAAQAMGLIDSTLTSEQIRNNRQYLDVVTKLRSRIKTEQEGYTNIINIVVTDYNPEFTAKLANALAKVYTVESFKDRNLSAQRALEAVRHQRDVALRALRESETRVRNYREQNRFITMDGAAAQISTALASAAEELEKIRADIHQIDNILQEIDNNRDYIYNANLNLLLNKPNRFLEDLQNRLNQARVNKANYAQYYTPNHPTIKNLETEISNLEKRFIAELKAYRKNLVQAESAAYNKWKALDEDYKSLPLLSLNLSNLEREREINTQIYQTLEAKYQEALIRASEQVQEVSILRPAFVPTSPINPTMVGPTTAIGTVIGLILGIVLAFVAETLDTTFSTIEDIEKTLDTTVMGIIPFVNIEEIKVKLREKMETPVPDDILEMQARLFSHYDPKSTMAESFRNLRTNVHFALLDKGYKTIMVTSSVAGEGKTTVAANLAVSLAQIGINTLLVEADLRKPRISKLFGIEREPGITDIILRKEPLDSVIRTMSDLMMGIMSTESLESGSITGIEYLNILTCGRIEKNPSEIVASKLMDGLIAELKERYDVVIFDSAPVIQATDATVLGSKVDTTLLVYYQGKISRGTLRRSKSQLEMLKSDILGVVVNGMRADVSADYSDYKYSYEYHYHEGEKEPKSKVAALLSDFFLKPSEGLSQGFWAQLRKGRILLLALGLAAIIGGTGFIIKEIKNAKKTTPVAEQPSVITPAPRPDTIATTSDTSSSIPEPIQAPVQDIPAEIQQLRAELGIKPQEEPSTLATSPPQTPAEPSSRQAQVSTQAAPPALSTYHSEILKLESSHPYTILIKRSRNLNSLKSDLNTYRQEGVPVFITPDYTEPEVKRFALCTGGFSDAQAAKKKINSLRQIEPKANFRVVELPYSLILANNSSEKTLNKMLQNNITLKYYLYILSSIDPETKAPKFYLLFGAFPSPETAEISQTTFPELQTAILAEK